MGQPRSYYSRARKIFLSLFIISSLITLCLFAIPPRFVNVSRTPTAMATYQGTSLPGTSVPVVPPPAPSAFDLESLAVYGSCLTSVVTFMGFISTTMLSWRKQVSDEKDKELERKLKEIELEKQRLEIEAMKKGGQEGSRHKEE